MEQAIDTKQLSWSEIQRNFRRIFQLMERASDRSSVNYKSTVDYIEDLESGSLTLWARLLGGEISAIILEQTRWNGGKPYLRVPFVAGESAEEISTLFDSVEEHYIELGFDIEIFARPGFAKILAGKGFSEKARVMEKRIS